MVNANQSPLRRMRLAAGLTIRQLEKRTGINRGRLSIIERGVAATEDEWERITLALAEGFLAAALREGPQP